MSAQDPEKRIKELEQELNLYKKRIEQFESINKLNSKWRWWLAKKTGGIFLGWRLQNSIRDLFSELKAGKVSSETLGDVTTHTLWRFTRVGLFAVLAALVPVTFLGIQTYILSNQTKILSKQNDKLDSQNKLFLAQNDRIKQQTYLQEAERRSSLVFLFNNVLDKIDEELKEQNGKTYTLSKPLIGRIVSLSRALKPYQYLEGDSITSKAVSPERGQLLISLMQSKLRSTTYRTIFRNADFSYADLREADLRWADLSGANLSKADLSGADLFGVNLCRADLSKADLSGAVLFGVDLSRADLFLANLSQANLSGANLSQAILLRANLSQANLLRANLNRADLLEADLREADLREADLRKVIVGKIDWIDYLIEKEVRGAKMIDSIYIIDTTLHHGFLGNYEYYFLKEKIR